VPKNKNRPVVTVARSQGRKQALRIENLIDDPVVEVLMAAAIAFQGVDRGKLWLSTPTQAFNNEAP
jgi:hypothetical protein